MTKKINGNPMNFQLTGIYMIFFLYPCLATAQDESIGGPEKSKHSIYGGPVIDTYNISGKTAITGGFMVGWAIEIDGRHRIGLEASIRRLKNRVSVQENNYGDVLYLHLTNIGIGFSYTNTIQNPVSFTFRNTISTGLSNYHFGNFQTDMQSGYTVFTMEPEVLINYRITKFIKASTGLTYNMAASSDYFLISSKQLSGLAGTVRITFRTGL